MTQSWAVPHNGYLLGHRARKTNCSVQESRSFRTVETGDVAPSPRLRTISLCLLPGINCGRLKKLEPMSDGSNNSHPAVQKAFRCSYSILFVYICSTQVLSLLDLGQVFPLCWHPLVACWLSLEKSHSTPRSVFHLSPGQPFTPSWWQSKSTILFGFLPGLKTSFFPNGVCEFIQMSDVLMGLIKSQTIRFPLEYFSPSQLVCVFI